MLISEDCLGIYGCVQRLIKSCGPRLKKAGQDDKYDIADTIIQYNNHGPDISSYIVIVYTVSIK